MNFGWRATHGIETPTSVSIRAITSAEIIEAMTPIDSVTPKPWTGPVASTNSSPAASSVVTLESMMADHALLNPMTSARLTPALGASSYSSRARSKTSTLASIASPIASTKPARPGRVSVAPSATSMAYAIRAYDASAIVARNPTNR